MPDRLKQAKAILAALGLPEAQQNDRSALTLMALARVDNETEWASATNQSFTVRKGIMDYITEDLGVPYAENSRESFRRQTLHQFVQAGVVAHNIDDPTRPTNSSLNNYTLTDEALTVVKAYGTSSFDEAVSQFRAEYGSLVERYAQARTMERVAVRYEGDSILLSPGMHNEVERAVVEGFGSLFAPGSILIYLGDTAKKSAYVDVDALSELGIEHDSHDKLPDVILFDEEKRWLYLVEAVTSHGPMTPKRVSELQQMFADVHDVGLIYVSAFPDKTEFRKHSADIAWETEVWIVEEPTHLLHYNGERFLGPH